MLYLLIAFGKNTNHPVCLLIRADHEKLIFFKPGLFYQRLNGSANGSWLSVSGKYTTYHQNSFLDTHPIDGIRRKERYASSACTPCGEPLLCGSGPTPPLARVMFAS